MNTLIQNSRCPITVTGADATLWTTMPKTVFSMSILLVCSRITSPPEQASIQAGNSFAIEYHLITSTAQPHIIASSLSRLHNFVFQLQHPNTPYIYNQEGRSDFIFRASPNEQTKIKDRRSERTRHFTDLLKIVSLILHVLLVRHLSTLIRESLSSFSL